MILGWYYVHNERQQCDSDALNVFHDIVVKTPRHRNLGLTDAREVTRNPRDGEFESNNSPSDFGDYIGSCIEKVKPSAVGDYIGSCIEKVKP